MKNHYVSICIHIFLHIDIFYFRCKINRSKKEEKKEKEGKGVVVKEKEKKDMGVVVEREKEKKRKGSMITSEIVSVVCERIAEGGSLQKTCKDLGIQAGTFLHAIIKKENINFFQAYTRACDIRADVYVEQIVTLADESNDRNYNAQRLKIDARKWIASKFKPRKYGEEITHSGSLDVVVEVVNYAREPKKMMSVNQEKVEGNIEKEPSKCLENASQMGIESLPNQQQSNLLKNKENIGDLT